MTKRKHIGLNKIGQRGFSGERLRAGMAKDKLIFVITCSAAIAVAVLTTAFTLWSGGSGGRMGPSQWQCLEPGCGYEFSKNTREHPPIECPKCGGQAVRVNYRKCPRCGKNVLVSRMRLTEQGQARYQNIKGSSGQVSAMPRGPGMALPMEIQFWAQQADGSFGWTDWILPGDPQIGQSVSVPKCSKCAAPLYGD